MFEFEQNSNEIKRDEVDKLAAVAERDISLTPESAQI